MTEEADKLLKAYHQNKAEAKIQIMVEDGYRNKEITREAYKILNRCIQCGVPISREPGERRYVRCIEHRRKNSARQKRNRVRKKLEKTLAEEIMQ